MTKAGETRKIITKKGGTLIPYQKGKSGNPNGKPKSNLNKICEELSLKFDFSVAKSDVKKLMQMLLFASVDDLNKIKNNKDLPAVIVSYIRAIFHDIRTGELNATRDILAMNLGRNAVLSEEKDFSKMSPEDVKKEIEKNALAAFNAGIYELSRRMATMPDSELARTTTQLWEKITKSSDA